MSMHAHQNSAIDPAVTRLLFDAARAEARALRSLNRGFPINVLRDEDSHTTDALLTPREIEALRWMAKFGWLRWWMLARLMWPASPAESARTLAMKMIRDLEDERLIYPVVAGDGHDVYLLDERGAAYLRTYFPDLYARDLSAGRRGLTAGTRQTSATGATFLHRLLTNAYLAEAVANGRGVATEYEQLVETSEWRTGWSQVAYRAKRVDGLTFEVGERSDEEGALLLDPEIIETLRNAPKVSLTRNASGAPVVQDDMGRFLASLREHSANGQRVTIVVSDDRAGHQVADVVVRNAVQRGIPVSPQFIRFAFIAVRPGLPMLGPFRHAPWPQTSRAPAAPPVTAAGQNVPVPSGGGGNTSQQAATAPAPRPGIGNSSAQGKAAHAGRPPVFRLVLDKHFANGDREAIIQHLATGFTAQAATGGTLNRGYMEFGLFDTEGEPLFLGTVVRDDTLDLTDAAQFNDLCTELLKIIPGSDHDD